MRANEADSERVDVVAGEADREQTEHELRKQSEIVLSQLKGTASADAERRERYQEQWHEVARQVEMEHCLCISMARKSSRLAANPDLSQKRQRPRVPLWILDQVRRGLAAAGGRVVCEGLRRNGAPVARLPQSARGRRGSLLVTTAT